MIPFRDCQKGSPPGKCAALDRLREAYAELEGQYNAMYAKGKADASTGEPVAWQFLGTGVISNQAEWKICRTDDVENFRQAGYEVRPLYTHPTPHNAGVADGELALAKLAGNTDCDDTIEIYYGNNHGGKLPWLVSMRDLFDNAKEYEGETLLAACEAALSARGK